MANAETFPKSIGLLLFPQFEVLDVSGPMEAFIILTRKTGFEDIRLSIISKTLDPVSPGGSRTDKPSNTFADSLRYLPTHTFENAPQLDMLLLPGGPGAFDPLPNGDKADLEDHIKFVRDAYNGYKDHEPLQYIMSICNGTVFLIQAGILDGHTATTNKDFWKKVTDMGPKTDWIAKARWQSSGNIWTSSGVSAGADAVFAWMDTLLPNDLVTDLVNNIGWNRATEQGNDPFAEIFGCEDVPAKS